MSTQTSRSPMEQGELISYETNLAACYEAEYLLALQYKANCQCVDHHSLPTSSLMETAEYGTCQDAEMESTNTNPREDVIESDNNFNAKMEYNTCQNAYHEMESTNPREDITESDKNFNARKRPYIDANNCSCWTNVNVPMQPKNSSYYYNGGASLYSSREHDNTLMVVTGQLSPNVKRMCFEAKQCQS